MARSKFQFLINLMGNVCKKKNELYTLIVKAPFGSAQEKFASATHGPIFGLRCGQVFDDFCFVNSKKMHNCVN